MASQITTGKMDFIVNGAETTGEQYGEKTKLDFRPYAIHKNKLLY